jgi:predicted PurR-regulated permease PerM
MNIQAKIIFRVLYILVGIIFYFSAIAQTKEVPYTLDDRDRMIRLEEQIQSLRNDNQSLRNEMQAMRNEFNAKFEALNSKIEVIFWGFGVIISLMLFLLGYIIFDRKKDIEPLKEKTHSISERQNNVIKALRDFANENPKLLEFLKSHGLYK